MADLVDPVAGPFPARAPEAGGGPNGCPFDRKIQRKKLARCAKLAADYLTDGAPDSECVIVASSYTQATVIFHYVTAMVEAAWARTLGDRSRWQFQDSSTTALIRNRSTGRAVRALGCDPRTGSRP